MIFIRGVIVDAVVFKAAGQTARQWFPARGLIDELPGGHDADQIARQFLGALSLNPQAGARGRPAANRPKQEAQRVRLATGNVRQFMRQHADHGLVGMQTGQKDRAKFNRARFPQNHGRIVTRVNVRLDSSYAFDPLCGRRDPGPRCVAAVQVILFCQLYDHVGNQRPGGGQQPLSPARSRYGVRVIYRQRRSGLHFIDRHAAQRIANPLCTGGADRFFHQPAIGRREILFRNGGVSAGALPRLR
jgi:hypothetical protein